jgi:hypothetical protein
MNTTTFIHRLTAAACAAVIAGFLAGCAGAADTGGSAARTSVVSARQQTAIRFVPGDNDPRGRHIVREAVSGPALHELLLSEAAERYLTEILIRARLAAGTPAPGVDDVLSPLTGLTRSELRGRQASNGGAATIDPPGAEPTGIDPRLTPGA